VCTAPAHAAEAQAVAAMPPRPDATRQNWSQLTMQRKCLSPTLPPPYDGEFAEIVKAPKLCMSPCPWCKMYCYQEAGNHRCDCHHQPQGIGGVRRTKGSKHEGKLVCMTCAESWQKNTETWRYPAFSKKFLPYQPDFYEQLLKKKEYWPGGNMGGDDKGLKIIFESSTGLPHTLQRFRKAIFTIYNKEFAEYHQAKPSDGMPGYKAGHATDLNNLRKELEGHCCI